MKLRILSYALLSVLSLSVYSNDYKDNKQNKKALKIEAKADGIYIRQEFEKAMDIYQTALKESITDDYAAVLNLKVARLYLSLLDYKAALPHFEKAISLNETQVTSVDICNYLDALRFSGDKMKAIVVARKYAYHDAYRLDQRYLNILHALNYEDGFMPVGVPEFVVKKLDNTTTPYSEFWVGKMKDEFFFASSNSNFHDANKRFYHRTRYYSLNEGSEYTLKVQAENEKNKKKGKRGGLLSMIPIDLQNGPLTFADDMSKMVVTAVSYKNGSSIKMSATGLDAFKTKLYLSKFDKKRNGWSAFKEALPQLEGYSYAHPYLFNNGNSLFFSSDMPGGFGGYDLYMTHWNESLQTWGEPINLGAMVNTEGDEISPTIHDGLLIFSSNGHVGFGGYDLYSIFYENEVLVDGSLSHFDYPINTALNDFSMLRMDNDRGYIISDRETKTKDDVYYFERNKLFKSDNLIYGLTEAKAISTGVIDLLNSEGNNVPGHQGLLAPVVYSESLLNVYFDFDKSMVNRDAQGALQQWLSKTDFSKIESIVVDGYTDELGSEGYNHRLSIRRAQSIAAWLRQNGISVPVEVHGRGKMILTQSEKADNTSYPISFVGGPEGGSTSIWRQKIWENRKARRADIKAKLK